MLNTDVMGKISPLTDKLWNRTVQCKIINVVQTHYCHKLPKRLEP